MILGYCGEKVAQKSTPIFFKKKKNKVLYKSDCSLWIENPTVFCVFGNVKFQKRKKKFLFFSFFDRRPPDYDIDTKSWESLTQFFSTCGWCAVFRPG